MQQKKIITQISIANSDDKCLKYFKTPVTENGTKMPINPKLPLVFDSIEVGYEGYTLVPNKLYAFNQTIDVDPQATIEQDQLLRMLGFDIFVTYMPARDKDGKTIENKMIVSASFDVVEPVMIYPDTLVACVVKMVEVDENGNEIETVEPDAIKTENSQPVPMEIGPSEA